MTLVMAIHVNAASVNATILLPDGNVAPFAEVVVEGKSFAADANGNVVLDVADGVKTANVKWLSLSAELPIASEMKLKNKLYYGAPYDQEDFTVNGEDNWEIDKKSLYNPGDKEAQIFYDDSFADFVFRTKFTLDKAKDYYYLRFFFRTVEPGFNGYGLSVPNLAGYQIYFTRFEGDWNKYTALKFIAPPAKVDLEYELVVFLKNEKIEAYLRPTNEPKYNQILNIEDTSDGAYFDGGFSIMASFLEVKLTELAVFAY